MTNGGPDLGVSESAGLPVGQIFFTDGSSDVEIYTSHGKAKESWAPVIQSVDHEHDTCDAGQAYGFLGSILLI
ncbi:MAG: hypothetical protein ABSF15_25375 [Candidatus Sulfotelmatobacter sp.]